MKKLFLFILILGITTINSVIAQGNEKTSLTYDFSFAELAIKYLETGNPKYLYEISNLDATTHLLNHALNSGADTTLTKLELVTYLLSPIEEQRELLPTFKRNLNFVKENLTKSGIVEKTTLQFLPEDFTFSGTMFFTFGYNSVAHRENNSLNLAYPIFSDNMNEIIYVAIHELHHMGFIALQDDYTPSIVDIITYKDMLHLIEYCIHLEGIATYAPFGVIEQDLKGLATDELFGTIEIKQVSAMNFQKYYIVLQDSQLTKELVEEFFDIYFHFKNEPDKLLTDEDWHKFQVFTYIKGLQYIVGAHIAKTIDKKLGRGKLISLISEPSESFIATYLDLKR